MPDLNRKRREWTSRSDPAGWVPDGISALVLIALAVAVALFFRVLYRVRDRIGLEEEMFWIFAGGFLLIEVYLLWRARRQGQRALEIWREGRE